MAHEKTHKKLNMLKLTNSFHSFSASQTFTCFLCLPYNFLSFFIKKFPNISHALKH